MRKNKNYPLYDIEEYESLNQMVCRKAQKCGNKFAFQYTCQKKNEKITYKKFLEDILVSGEYLEQLCDKHAHIAILGENSYQWLVVFMAVIMSGRVAIPLDKEESASGIQDLLSRSNTSICVHAIEYQDIAKEAIQKTQVILLSMDYLKQLQNEQTINRTILEDWDNNCNPNELAAIFYTSGTSGKSKGVMLSQTNMISNINMACKNYLSQGSSLAVLPFHHSFGLLTAVFALYNHEHVVFINSSLKNIKTDMMLAKPKTMLLVPLFVETFHKTIWQRAKKQGQEKKLQIGLRLSRFLLYLGIDIRNFLFHSVLEGFGGELKFIICGGAPLQEKYIQEFRALGIELLNGYGITECSPVVATNRNYYHKDGSVGLILKDCEVRIKKEHTNSKNGEIQIRGKNVMLGYYQDEQETQAVFEEDWFSTGDLGYVDQDGFLYVTGRKKNLIILSNGENVSPEELENMLLIHELVKEVIVYAENGIIVAEIYPDMDSLDSKTNIKETTKQLQEIINICNHKLPTYKRIQKLKVRQAEFTKTTTQKIKR